MFTRDLDLFLNDYSKLGQEMDVDDEWRGAFQCVSSSISGLVYVGL